VFFISIIKNKKN